MEEIFVDLSQEQRVYFQAFMAKQALESIHSHNTHLTTFFSINIEDSNIYQFLCPDIRCHPIFCEKEKFIKSSLKCTLLMPEIQKTH